MMRQLSVRPELARLTQEADEILIKIQSQRSDALIQDLPQTQLDSLKKEDIRELLAHDYGVESWARLELSCSLIRAIWEDDLPSLKMLIRQHPKLLHENARGTAACNWGKVLSYAANVGRNEIVRWLIEAGAEDVQFAFERACLQGKLDTARLLHSYGARPVPGSVLGPCETLNAPGLALQIELGAKIEDGSGDPLAPIALILETYSRNPIGKHHCLELCAQQGFRFPDTAVMAVHRGRLDLLQDHYKRDPTILHRTFSHHEIYPLELGCHADQSLALCGTPLSGGTLLHIAVEDNALSIADWLIKQGALVNAQAAVDGEGFGGHTSIFACVVSQSYRCGWDVTPMAKFLLANGAKTDVRVNLRKRLRFVEDESVHVYVGVTPKTWGEQFHEQAWVDQNVLALLDF